MAAHTPKDSQRVPVFLMFIENTGEQTLTDGVFSGTEAKMSLCIICEGPR